MYKLIPYPYKLLIFAGILLICLPPDESFSFQLTLLHDSTAQGDSEQKIDLDLNTASRPSLKWDSNKKKYLLGAATGFILHESGHLAANAAVGSGVEVKEVRFGPLPFFTLAPDDNLGDRSHYIVTSAGLNVQNIVNEWILTKHPDLKERDKPYLKGIFFFNTALSLGYASAAILEFGEARDTEGMADSLNVDEASIGLAVLLPALLDLYRYYHPDAGWAKWAGRISKAVMIGAALHASD